MSKKNKSSRRKFLKSTALASGSILGSSLYGFKTTSKREENERNF